jgi:spore coat protein U-like protein
VQASVTALCSINATTLDFGTPVGVLTSSVPGTSTISVQCANGISYNVGLDGGLNSGNNINARKMVMGTNSVAYQLYRDSSRTQVWGNTVNTDTVQGTGNGSIQSLTVYGNVPVQTTPPAGTYQDTVVVSVTY